ncbi:hypothetical protein C7Y47_24130 [Lysinibacillus sphaericus]|uniref:Uncharacterized protein n=1 Tax=Lysinibacillus sphaericus TaxID=1421 RepID=A0A544U7B5_LYSSH|nr:hypothetical protein [Lysinibacillus sp. SDF0037]TQR26827.1 hypothetical protein C7Y47_24130 [Lysinibacillus sp. SDF0037]
MEGYIQMALGISVSIIIYLLGYKQTIGAKKERIKAANSEIEKILIRRIVNDNYNLNVLDIIRLTQGKARDFMVRVEDLLNTNEILNALYTRIIESDFITKEQRENTLSILRPLLEDVYDDFGGGRRVRVKVKDIFLNKQGSISIQPVITVAMAIVASLLGSIISNPSILKGDLLDINFNLLSIPLIGSLLGISFISLLKRFKESQQEVTISSTSRTIEEALNFEKEVAEVISRKTYTALPMERNKEYDFFIHNNEKKIIIEVKLWKRGPNIGMLKRTIERLKDAVVNENATEGIIVIKLPFKFDEKLIESNIKIMTLDQLKKYL